MASHDTNLEVFVSKQLDFIEAAASGRSKEHKELREGCQELKSRWLFSYLLITATK